MTDLPTPHEATPPPDSPPEEPPRWELVQPPVPVAPPSGRGRRWQALLAVGVLAVLLVAVVAGVTAAGRSPQTASAQGGTSLAGADPTPTPTPQASSQCQAFMSDLAKRLGVSESTLQGAVTGALQDMIDQAVSSGRITQEQGNALKSKLSSAQGTGCLGFGGLRDFGPGRVGPFGPGMGPGMGPGVRGIDPLALLNAASSALKIDNATLLSDLRSGKDLQSIAQSQGVPYSTVTTAIQNAAKQQLDAAVKSGSLTTSQESAILNALQSALQAGKFPFGAGGFGFRGGDGSGDHPFGTGPWGGRGQGPAATPAPTTGPLSGA